MPLVPAKCPECGGNINIEHDKKAAICEFCKHPFIVEEAINKFNTTYNITNHNDIKADVVNVYESKEKDFIIKAGILEKYIGEDVNIIIPNTVKKIGKDAFKDLLIETVDIPDSVIAIESGAFYNCKDLKSVVMANSVERIESGGHNPGWALNYALHGGGAFEKCSSLNQVIISNQLVYLGNNAFTECVSLSKVQLPPSLEHIGDCAFKGCTELQEIGSTENVTSIGRYAFSGCSSIKKIDAHNVVEMYGDHTFSECLNLEEVDLPERITNIYSEWCATFACNKKLKYIKIPEGVKKLDGEKNDDYINPKEMFHDCGSLEQVVLPESCSSIISPFKGCKSLKTINIPNSTYFIADGCFRECDSLINVEVSNIILQKYIKSFVGTPFWQNKKEQIDYCPYCGGNYRGVISKKCTGCGRSH